MRTLLTKVLVPLAVFGVALVGSAAIANALRDDPNPSTTATATASTPRTTFNVPAARPARTPVTDPSAPSAAGEPIVPGIGPLAESTPAGVEVPVVRVGDAAPPTWPERSPVHPVDDPAASSGSATPEDPTDTTATTGLVDPTAPADPTSTTSTTSTTGPGAPTTTGATTPAAPVATVSPRGPFVTLLGPLLAPLFIDPCAGDAPGSPRPETCPPVEGTMSGTVLLGGPPPPPFTIQSLFYTAPMSGGECPVGADEREIHGVVFTSNPAHLQFEVTPRGRPEDTVSLEADPTPTSRAAWYAAFERGDHPLHVEYCVTVPGAEPAVLHYAVEITGRDDFGAEATRSTGFNDPGLDPRPTSFVRPIDGDTIHLAIPSLSTPATEVVYEALAPTAVPEPGRASLVGDYSTIAAAPPPECRTIEHDVLNGRIGTRVPATDVHPLVIAGGAGRYDPKWNRTANVQIDLPSGPTYRMCIWVLQTDYDGHRSFDPPRIAAREMFLVSPPDRPSVRLRVDGADFSRDVEGREFRATPLNWPEGCKPERTDTRPGADVAFPPRAIGSGSHVWGWGSDHPPCDSGGYVIPDHTMLRVSDRDGHESVVDIPTGSAGECETRGATCSLRYDLLLPGPRIGSGMCSGSFGEACDPPTSEAAVGTAHLVVSYHYLAGRTSTDWVVHESSTFSGAGAEPRPRDPVIDVDDLDIQVTPVDGSTPGVATFGFTADRPVTARMNIEAPDPTQFCRVGGVFAEVRSDTIGTRHTLSFDGLCRGFEYSFMLEITDADGNRGFYGYYVDGAIVSGQHTPFIVRSPAPQLAIDVRIEGLGADSDLPPQRTEMAFGSDTTSVAGRRCVPAAGELTESTFDRYGSYVIPIDVAERQTLTHGWLGYQRDDFLCDPRVGVERRGDISTWEISLDDLLAGPVVVESPADAPVRVRVTLTIHPT